MAREHEINRDITPYVINLRACVPFDNVPPMPMFPGEQTSSGPGELPFVLWIIYCDMILQQ